MAKPVVARGGAHVDFNNDGLIDWIVVVHGGEAMVLKNISHGASPSEPPGHWLRIDLRQTGGNTYALGARAYVSVGGETQMAVVGSSSSYLSICPRMR